MGAYHSHPQRHVVSSLFSQLSSLFLTCAVCSLCNHFLTCAVYSLLCSLHFFPTTCAVLSLSLSPPLSLSPVLCTLFFFSHTYDLLFRPLTCAVYCLLSLSTCPASLLSFLISLTRALYSLLPLLNSPELQEMGRGGGGWGGFVRPAAATVLPVFVPPCLPSSRWCCCRVCGACSCGCGGLRCAVALGPAGCVYVCMCLCVVVWSQPLLHHLCCLLSAATTCRMSGTLFTSFGITTPVVPAAALAARRSSALDSAVSSSGDFLARSQLKFQVSECVVFVAERSLDQ